MSIDVATPRRRSAERGACVDSGDDAPGRAGVSRGLSSTLLATRLGVVDGHSVGSVPHDYFARAFTSLDFGLSPMELIAVT
jgi:hypothetical protein